MDNPWNKWKAEKRAQREAERLAQFEARQKQPKMPRPMTEGEAKKVTRLQKVTTAWGSRDGHFIQQLKGATTETQITERQAEYIEILWYKYRRQLGHKDPMPPYYELHSDF